MLLTTNVFPLPCKSSIVTTLIKKPGLDAETLKNYRPVSNLSFLSKVIEKVIASRIISHIENNAIIDKFQSAYKCGHSTETALLRVYSDIVTTIGKGNGPFLVLLDLSAAFDTIDHSVYIPGMATSPGDAKHGGVWGSASCVKVINLELQRQGD